MTAPLATNNDHISLIRAHFLHNLSCGFAKPGMGPGLWLPIKSETRISFELTTVPNLPTLRNRSEEVDSMQYPVVISSSEELMKSFLSGRKATTLRAYAQDMETFRSFLGAQDTNEAARALLNHGPAAANTLTLRYKNHMTDSGLKSATIARRLSTLRSLTQLARLQGLISWKIEIANPKVETYRDTRGVRASGFQKLTKHAERRNDVKGIRDRAILYLLHDLALRRSELIGLDREDLDLTNRTIRILGKGKTDKQTLSLPERTAQALAAWVEIRGDEPGALFTNLHRSDQIAGTRLSGTSLYRIVQGLGEKTDQKVTPHKIRHTAITQAVKKAQEAGLDVTRVLHFSRHANLKTLQTYIDNHEDYQGRIADLVAG